jgi:hypothetical protein
VRPAAAIVATLFVAGVADAQDSLPQSLTGGRGDPARGRAIVTNRQVGLCLLCHSGPFPEERFQGNLAPDLKGAGARWTEGQLRLRLVDSSRGVDASCAGVSRQADPERGANRGRGGLSDDAA